jgi:hypothetical protein
VLKPGIGSLLAIACLCAAAVTAFAPDSRHIPAGTSAPAAQPAPEAAGWRSGALPKRESIGEPQGALFASTPSAAPARPLPAQGDTQAVPVALPMPYRIAGQVTGEGKPQVVFARGDRVIIAGPGDSLDDDYRLESVRSDGVTLVYLPLNRRQELLADGVLDAESPQAAAEPSQSSIASRLRSARRGSSQ